MNIAEFTIRNKVLSIIVILIVMFGGWSAYQNMPRFEDPEFTIRQAQIITIYPGADPRTVAEEVTEPLERALQQLMEVKEVRSVSSVGMSEISVEITYESSPTKADLQLIWAKVRNKVSDAAIRLPSSAQTPMVYDDFGDVFGLYYLLTGEGYSPAEMYAYAKELQSEILQVDGVARVAMGGEFSEAVFVEVSRTNAAALGVSIGTIYNTLSQQGSVFDSGDVTLGNVRMAIQPTRVIDSVSAIENLLIAATAEGNLIYLKDVASVSRGYQTPPQKIMRYNGKPAIALGISNVLGGNIVEISKAVDQRLEDSMSRRPIGMALHEFYHQGNIVEASVADFVNNVIAALVIVIVILLIFMGLKPALVIGAILLLTIFATLLTMDLAAIPMHRISLGALIIALGMMVDNAIVVTEGILVGVQQGKDKMAIAKGIVKQTIWPLLGGTLVGIIAFAPIGFAPGSTAEYTNHLFWVMLISLMYSWVFAITLTPLFCYWLFSPPKDGAVGQAKKSKFLQGYQGLIKTALKFRVTVVVIVVGMFLASVWGFQFVKPGFMPSSTTPQFVIDYWLPQGTDIAQTTHDIRQIEQYVAELDGVTSYSSSVGGGTLRFMLVYSPESMNSAYGQILVRVEDYRIIDGMKDKIQAHIAATFPDSQSKPWRFVLGPGGGSKIEATFKGPDPKMLRTLSDKARQIMAEDGDATFIKDTWRQQVAFIEPLYSEEKGGRAGISRQDLAQALATNFSGRTVGVYREGDEALPIISRAPEQERRDLENIRSIGVVSSVTGQSVPIGQVVDGFRTGWRDANLRREDRIWTITTQCDPINDLPSELLARLRPKIEAIPLPDGYTLEWDGEYGSSTESNEALATTLPFGFLAMVLVVFILFGTVRQPVLIWLIVPLALIGVVFGLVLAQLPLEFMAILGLLSLSGLLIKNAIVLVDQIDLEIKEGKPRFDAIIESASGRVRPVMMGTLTTVLGVLPLYFDAFFKSMSVVIIFGLTFATALTLVVAPVLYGLFFKIHSGESENA